MIFHSASSYFGTPMTMDTAIEHYEISKLCESRWISGAEQLLSSSIGAMKLVESDPEIPSGKPT